MLQKEFNPSYQRIFSLQFCYHSALHNVTDSRILRISIHQIKVKQKNNIGLMPYTWNSKATPEEKVRRYKQFWTWIAGFTTSLPGHFSSKKSLPGHQKRAKKKLSSDVLMST